MLLLPAQCEIGKENGRDIYFFSNFTVYPKIAPDDVERVYQELKDSLLYIDGVGGGGGGKREKITFIYYVALFQIAPCISFFVILYSMSNWLR